MSEVHISRRDSLGMAVKEIFETVFRAGLQEDYSTESL